MVGYFKPLRRKIGVVTLMMACAFMALWVRSITVFDNINLELKTRRYAVSSIDGRLWLYRTTSADPKKFINWSTGDVSYRKETGNLFDPLWFGPDSNIEIKLDWRLELAGFHLSSGELDYIAGPVYFSNWMTPYYAIVVPLAILSAWLLLSKPRAKKAPEKQP